MTSPDRSAILDRVREWRTVGRDEELAFVVAALRSEPGAMVIAGDAGVGKSLLAAEAIRRLQEDGDTREVIRAHASASASGFGLAALAHLLPSDHGGDDAASLLRAVIDHLRRRAGDHGILLSVDDAHHLDDISAALLLHLAREPWAALVLTLRIGNALPAAITTLWKDRLAERLDLQPLTRVDVDELTEIACGGPVDASTTDQLWAASVGNPLYLRELIRDAVADRRLSENAGVWRLVAELGVPARLVELIEDRLEGLSREERYALEVVAIADAIGIDLLADAVGWPVVEGLEAGGLLEVGEDGRRRPARLAHPLYAESLVAAMPAARQRKIDLTVADLLGSTAMRRYSDVSQTASLRLDAGQRPDAPMLEDAALQAYRSFDLPSAERLARAARDAAPRRAVGATMMLAKLHRWRAEHEHADGLLATIGPEMLPDDEARARHAAIRAENLFRGAALVDEALSVLRRGQVECQDEWARWLAAHEAEFELFAGHLSRAVALAEPLSTDTTAPLGAIRACVVLSYAFGRAGRYGAAIDAGERGMRFAVGIADATTDDPAALWVGRALAFTDAGRFDEADRLAEVGRPLAAGIRLGLAWLTLVWSRLQLAKGDLGQAAASAREAAVVFEDNRDAVPARVGWAGLARVAAQAGDVDTACDALARADSLDPGVVRFLEPEVDWARAWVLAAEGELSAARQALDGVARDLQEAGQHGIELAVLHDAARLGGAGEVRDRTDALGFVVDGPLAPVRAGHVAGLADSDADALGQVAARFDALGAQLFAAEPIAHRAAALRRDRRSRDATAATTHARRLAEACGARTPAFDALDVAVPLTARETEVASLASRGLTSPEIADRLDVSVRTINNLLQRAYLKLGVTSRAALAEHVGAT